MLERTSIEKFVASHADKLIGDVLDFGAGQQPYRKHVQGVYHPFDRVGFPASTVTSDYPVDWYTQKRWDAILCTQVLQYVGDPQALVVDFHDVLLPGGWLVMTGPTCWPEIESDDLWRFTMKGVERMMLKAGFEQVGVIRRDTVVFHGDVLSIGWGTVGRRPM